jgi:lysosome membrane protein 2
MNKLNTSSVNFWSTNYANMINGTDGTLYAPFLNKSNPVYIFNNDICRSIYINYNETIHTLNNIEIYGYKPDPYFFGDHIENPDNGGFCTPAGNCLGAGVLNLTGCVGGIPIIMSNPHFLYGDPKYIVISFISLFA